MKKNTTEYILTESEINLEEEGRIMTYGISCIKNDVEIKKVEDLSPNRTAVKKFVKLLNKKKLDPVQLDEVIDDFIDDMI